MKWNYFLPIQGWLLGCFIFIYTTGFSISFTGHTPSNFQAETDRLFESDVLLSLTILSDFSSIMDDRGEDRSYHKGMMYYLNGDDTIFQKVRLKTRGNFRRDPKNCKYPPIMVKFGKVTDSVFADQSKLKLVTQCQIEDYVLLEFLAYRIFNLLTDNSYRVRLTQITYADLKTKEAYFTRYAFFIESEKELASRLDAEIYKPNVVQYYLNRENIITVAMFQFLIGNDDWYVTSKHNTSILKKNENENLIAVPYDFDWSDLVGAKYTKPVGVPNNQLKVRRVYKGLCMETKDFEKQKDLFASIKDEIVELIRSQEDLPKYRKQESIRYIEKFYKTLNNSSSLERIFQKEKCVKEPVFEK